MRMHSQQTATGKTAADSGEVSSSMTSRVRSGVVWNLVGQVAQQVLRVGFSILLARLLSPREFGLIGMVGVFTGFAGVFVNMGLGQAIVQRKELRPEHLSTGFTLSLLSSVTLAVLFWAGSGLIASLYGEPILQPLVAVLSLQFLLSASTLVHSALLTRAMRFKEAALIDLAAFISGSTTAVVAAWRGWGVWSLVLNSLVYAGTSMTLFWWRSGWKPRLGIHWQCARELWSYGSHLMGFSALHYWARNADNYLIGKYCGAADLGAYARAYQLMLLPVEQLLGIVVRVLFPALSQIQDDLPRFREVIFRTQRMLALVSFPIGALLVVLAEPLVLVLFGAKWASVTPLLQILALNVLGQSISLQGVVYNSLGRTDLTFKIGGINSVLFVLSFLIGLPWGAKGVALSYTIVWYLVVFPFSWKFPMELLGLRWWHVVWNVKEMLLLNLLMVALTYAVLALMPSSLPPLARLVVPASTGAGFYWGVLHLTRNSTYLQAVQFALGRGGQR